MFHATVLEFRAPATRRRPVGAARRTRDIPVVRHACAVPETVWSGTAAVRDDATILPFRRSGPPGPAPAAVADRCSPPA